MPAQTVTAERWPTPDRVSAIVNDAATMADRKYPHA
jgi:hypothetical protein